MKIKTKVVVMAMCLTVSSFAFAQVSDNHGEHGRNMRTQQKSNVRVQQNKTPRPGMDQRAGRSNDRVHYEQAQRGRGVGPRHDMYKGRRLDPEYRSRQYRIDDWRGHGLYAPPRGYYWAQVGADYVLVGIATGIILNVMMAH